MPVDALQSATDTIIYEPKNGVVPPDSVIRVWEIASGAVTDYALPDDRVLDLAFIEDGRVIVVGSAENVTRYEYDANDNLVRVVDALEQETGLEYDELKGIQWEWQSMDGAMTKSPLGGEKNREKPDRSRQTRRQTVGVDRRTRCAVGRGSQWSQYA